MSLVFACHEHELKLTADKEQYEREVGAAIKNLRISGLIKAIHLRGFKGARKNKYAVLWLFQDKGVIEKNFGTENNPKMPEAWVQYENDILAKFLTTAPDKIVFTDYMTLSEYDKI